MTRKDSRRIAEALRRSKPKPIYEQGLFTWTGTVHRVAWALTDSNPQFDRERFLEACGI